MVWLLRSTGKRKRASQDKSGAKFYNLMQDITRLRVAKWSACPTLSAAGCAQLPFWQQDGFVLVISFFNPCPSLKLANWLPPASCGFLSCFLLLLLLLLLLFLFGLFFDIRVECFQTTVATAAECTSTQKSLYCWFTRLNNGKLEESRS